MIDDDALIREVEKLRLAVYPALVVTLLARRFSDQREQIDQLEKELAKRTRQRNEFRTLAEHRLARIDHLTSGIH